MDNESMVHMHSRMNSQDPEVKRKLQDESTLQKGSVWIGEINGGKTI